MINAPDEMIQPLTPVSNPKRSSIKKPNISQKISAIRHRRNNPAASPAVDAGSKDWLNGGTTKTDVDGNGNIPDNPAPANFGDPDNLDGNGEPTFIDWNNGSRLLDIGYHYGGDAQTKDSSTIYTTLRHPKERIPDFTYNEETIKPNITLSEEMAIVSGRYDSETGKDTTIAIYRGTTMLNGDITVGYRVFRGSSEEIGIIDTFSRATNSWYPGVMVAGASGPSGDDNQGTIYAAVSYWQAVPGSTSYVNVLFINIYRYNHDTSPPAWQKIGHTNSGCLVDGSLMSLSDLRQPIGLAAQGHDLWVFWTDEEPDATIKIWGAHIPDADTDDDPPMNFKTNPLIDFDFSDLSNDYISLVSDWDDYTIIDGYPNGMPRIVYVQKYVFEESIRPQVWAKRILLDSNSDIDQFDSIPTQPIGENNIKPTLSINRPLARFLIPIDANRAYCRFTNTDENQIVKRNLNIDYNGQDIWGTPSYISGCSEPSVISSAFGTDRLFYMKNLKLTEENRGEFSQASGIISMPKAHTERTKPENIFLIHRGDDNDMIDMYHIEP